MLERLDRSKLPGTWLLIGTDAIEQAHSLAHSILDTDKSFHPDLAVCCPEGKGALHSIASMRQLCESVPPITIIEHADRMLPTSANALLKTFEEPPPGAIILLTTRHPYRLLPTVLSRCRRIQLEPPHTKRHAGLEDFLRHAPFGDYGLFQKELGILCKQIEEHRATVERETLERLTFPEMTPHQKDRVTKQAEGAGTLAYLHEVEQVLEDLLLAQKDPAPAEPKVSAAWTSIQRHSRLEPTLESCLLSLTII
jgi:DNA polymerase III, delta subunit